MAYSHSNSARNGLTDNNKMKTSSVYEIPADKYNKKLAETLKAMPEFKEPEWAIFVKTGVAKKRPPQEKDFWHKRAASILRQIYVNRVVGVNRLKTRYGSKKNRGMKPEKFKKASGKIIRTILQQAEAAGLLEKTSEPKRKAGRRLTKKGKELLEGISLEKIKEEAKPIEAQAIEPTQEKPEEITKENKQEEIINEEKTEEKQDAKEE